MLVNIGDIVRIKQDRLQVTIEERETTNNTRGTVTRLVKSTRRYTYLKSFVFLVLREHPGGAGLMVLAVLSHDKFVRTHTQSGCSNVYDKNSVVGAEYALPAEILEGIC